GVRQRGAVHSVYRYSVRPIALTWKASIEPTRLRATFDQTLFIERTRTVVEAQVRLQVERGPGVYEIEIEFPGDFEVVRAQGPGLHDWWVRDGVLVLARKQRQRASTSSTQYSVIMRKRGSTAEMFSAPALFVRGAARQTGVLKLALADGLEIETGEATSLLPLDIANVKRPSWGKFVRAYRFVAVPWQLSLKTREETREVEALVISRAVPLADHVRMESLIDFDVRRGLVDELSFVVPVATEADVLVRAEDLREEVSSPVPGGRRYTLKLRTPTRGNATVTVLYHLPYTAALRGPEPLAASRVRRYVAVEKIPDGAVRVSSSKDLDDGEFDDLPVVPPGSSRQSIAHVLVGSGGPFELNLAVTRHTFEEVARAVIYRAAAQAIVERAGWVRVLVSYRVYNRAEQFLRLNLPDDSTLYSVVVAGDGVRPLGEAGTLLVPLRKLALGSQTFDVDVLYAYRAGTVGDADNEIRLPEVEDLEVRRTTLSLYLPKGFDYSFDTEMEEVEEADIAAGEATDLYQEIKELYSVAERGNAIQAQRAGANFQQLQREALRAMDKVKAQTRDDSQRKQVDQQIRALQTLEHEINRRAQQSKGPQQGEQTKEELKRNLDMRNWEANDAFLKNRRGAQELEQVTRYANKLKSLGAQQKDDMKLVPMDGITNGIQDSLSDGSRRSRSKQLDSYGWRFEELQKGGGAGGGGGGRPGGGVFANDDRDSGLDTGGLTTRIAADRSIADQSYRNARFRHDPRFLQSKRGRLSLRIELPKEGEVFHFARLGAHGGCSVDASPEGGRWLEGLLTIVFALGCVIALRCQPLR
ncbi:MAG: hypothetical protein OER88_10170, partial [Planctomycetota bacterium]|nr:hypothetical protein [Planctomycetota bacterium]